LPFCSNTVIAPPVHSVTPVSATERFDPSGQAIDSERLGARLRLATVAR